MENLLIEALICELDGTFYPVRLCTVPRVGELIKFYSRIDERKNAKQKTNYPPQKYYEVVQVKHRISDVDENGCEENREGFHMVEIFVKPSDSQFFKSSPIPSPPADLN